MSTAFFVKRFRLRRMRAAIRAGRASASFLSILVASGGGVLAQTPQERLPSVVLPPELDRVLRDYERGWEAGDADFLASLFTEDGFVMSPERPPVRGRTNITGRYANSGGALALRAMAYAVEGDVGYIIGAFGRAPDRDIGKFILALRRSPDGRWLIAADMDNGS